MIKRKKMNRMSLMWSTYRRIRIGILRAVPWSFMVSRITTGVIQIIIPYFIYVFMMKGNVTNTFYKYAGGADYMTYVVLGSALNVLAVSTLMNIGRAMITELREGTLEMLLLSPSSRGSYFAGCLMEQTTRALLEFGTVLAVGACCGANLGKIFSMSSLIVVAMAIFSFFCMGLLLSGVMLYTRDTYITQNTLFVSMSLVCGIAFPIQYLPQWVQHVAQIFPLTPAVTLFRNVMIGGQRLMDNRQLIMQVFLLSAGYMVLGLIWNRKLERLLLENIFG